MLTIASAGNLQENIIFMNLIWISIVTPNYSRIKYPQRTSILKIYFALYANQGRVLESISSINTCVCCAALC